MARTDHSPSQCSSTWISLSLSHTHTHCTIYRGVYHEICIIYFLLISAAYKRVKMHFSC